ncbi:MAG: Gfo/Idh/MocA family oxidoreductase [Lentisphaeria bacterium]|nr:Gfo/Idh/MocA family oxidoreductase [Lentisphaeria bacterium]
MIRLGLYGAGNRTRALLNSLIQDQFYCVESVYDLNLKASESLSETFGGKICRTPEELVENPEVDAFMISLSPFDHAEALRKVIPAGKPVFVEKPVSFSTREVRELAELADKYHTPVQVGFMRRYLPESIAMLDFIKQNEPGKLICIDCNWFHHGDTEMNYNLYHQPDNFRLKVSQIPFHCCHLLDIMLLVGGNVKEVSSRVLKIFDRPYPSPDDLISNIEFENGANGRFHYSSMVYYTEFTYRFHFENYSIKMNCGQNNLEIYHRPRFRTSQVGADPEHAKDFGKFNSSYESFCLPQIINFNTALPQANENIMFNFVRMVRDGIPPESDLHVAARVQALAEAIELSGKEKRTVIPAEL